MSVKKALRQRLLAERNQVPAETLAQWSLQIGSHIQTHDWFKTANIIYAYRSFRQEVCLTQLFKTHVQSKQWAFPRCEGKAMTWHDWSGQVATEFEISRFGIEEPYAHWPKAGTPDLILVPTVACDRQGYRLGYGGGFYDRMLVNLDPDKTRAIGIVPAILLQDELPIDPWDQPLDAICTEQGIFPVFKESTDIK